ncbi:MAG: chloride channel protein, partial [Alphaproteobacteria bacterium]|nr:chloride channel protein [Alphaproteobacteria bacterium]
HAAGWIGIGLIAGLAACLLTFMVYGIEDVFEHLPIHWMWWPALGAIAVGIGGLIDPAALGVGYPAIGKLILGALTGVAAVGLVLAKGIIWSIALGSGTSGGVLAPLLIVGGGIGAVLSPVMPHAAPGFWAVLAMAATLGGALGAPLTATLFAVELTGNHVILLPVFAACMSSMAVSVLLMKRSILTEKIARRGHHLNREYSIDPLTVTRIREIMAKKVVTLSPDTLVGEVIQRFASHKEGYRAFPVVDAEGHVFGMVTRSDVLVWIGDETAHQRRLIDMIDGRDLVLAHPEEMADAIAIRMLEKNVSRIPIVDHDGHLVGIISRADLLHAHHRAFTTERKRERFFRRRKNSIPSAAQNDRTS